jgi:glycosyltransferase involved in cell wall biosynthesis
LSLKFSIITCTWNSAQYLPKSIESVLSQDYQDIEYIFVDAGSEDNTYGLIKAIPRDIVYVTGIRGGISAAMNKGIELSTGDVIAHLHSDDYYIHSDVITRVAKILDESGAEWCFGRALNNVNGEVSPESWKVPVYTYRRLLKGNFIPHQATFIRSRVFNRLGMYNAKYRYAMDYDMWLRIGRVYKPIQVDEHWSVFRRHEGSLSTANQIEGFKEDFKIRMAYASKTPWDYAYHYAHFLVRMRRLRRKSVLLKRGGIA